MNTPIRIGMDTSKGSVALTALGMVGGSPQAAQEAMLNSGEVGEDAGDLPGRIDLRGIGLRAAWHIDRDEPLCSARPVLAGAPLLAVHRSWRTL